jgi:hypothetical protein
MTKNEFDKKLQLCLDHINIDFLPLNDIFRTLFGFDKLIPTVYDVPEILNIINALLTEYDIVCLEGPQMEPTKKSISDLLTYIKSMCESGQYNEINYGIWFDKKTDRLARELHQDKK